MIGLFFDCMSWLSPIIDIAIAVAAFIRLRNTPSGVLIGGGFALMGLFGVIIVIVRMVMTPDAAGLDVDYDAWIMQSTMIGAVGTCGTMLFMTVVAIGFFLLPKSLAKLAEDEATG
jgi:hypothetical protein